MDSFIDFTIRFWRALQNKNEKPVVYYFQVNRLLYGSYTFLILYNEHTTSKAETEKKIIIELYFKIGYFKNSIMHNIKLNFVIFDS